MAKRRARTIGSVLVRHWDTKRDGEGDAVQFNPSKLIIQYPAHPYTRPDGTKQSTEVFSPFEAEELARDLLDAVVLIRDDELEDAYHAEDRRQEEKEQEK